MIIDKLKQWKYYQQKLPLFLQNSYGVLDHFYIIFEILLQSDNVSEDILKGFDIFADDYSDYILKMSDNEYKLDILDKIGEIYGVSRYFNVRYVENNNIVIKALKLTNTELHKLILTKVIQTTYDGSYSNARELYEKINLPIYMLKNENDASVQLILDLGKYNESENILDMFKANLFTLKSIGINYSTLMADISSLAEYDSNESKHYWDKGLWS